MLLILSTVLLRSCILQDKPNLVIIVIFNSSNTNFHNINSVQRK